jgi:chromate reductase, NAD(P)H dehydrogenase (quinone)
MPSTTIHVLGIAGSLRTGSYNAAALRAARDLAPEGMIVEAAEIGDVPLYDEDVRAQGFPAPVQRLRNRIADADALLFVTPEYNFSVPGVLKNAIDWASRPPDQPFNDKPTAIMGAGPGLFGTARAQYHLRQILGGLNAQLLNKPEVMIREAKARFDEAGNLTDEGTREHVRKLLEALAAWTLRLRGG